MEAAIGIEPMNKGSAIRKGEEMEKGMGTLASCLDFPD